MSAGGSQWGQLFRSGGKGNDREGEVLTPRGDSPEGFKDRNPHVCTYDCRKVEALGSCVPLIYFDVVPSTSTCLAWFQLWLPGCTGLTLSFCQEENAQ